MMKENRIPVIVLMLALLLACNIPGFSLFSDPSSGTEVPEPQGQAQPPLDAGTEAETPEAPATNPPVAVAHVKTPSISPDMGSPIYDVESSGTAAEKRAPYGDSYDINRLERPFLQDMTYVSDLDIETFSLGFDTDFYYMSMDLIGSDPNNALGIQYGVELDTNADGFGDFVVLGRSPFSTEWSSANVQVFADNNHDTAGLSGDKSDAPITTNGYETPLFDGALGTNSDPDLAFVRMNYSDAANVQFAFKKSLPGGSFMYGVFADAGLTDVGQLDYVDRFKEAQAGSPVKDKKYYPLGALFAIDNTCREPIGFSPNGYEPMICPKDQPKPTRKATPVIIPLPDALPACLSVGTQIDTPSGSVSVEDLKSGDIVWTVSRAGERIAAPLLRVSHTLASSVHQVVHIVLSDGRELWASPRHPTGDGRLLGELGLGDLLDGASVTSVDLVPYAGSATYDLLPASDTGFYWANGILIGSTLADP